MQPTADYNLLYSFQGAPGDGSTPQAAMLDVNGTLYGTTYEGGANNDGSIFSITPSGDEKLLYSFNGYGSGGRTRPNPSSLINVNGTLYGTTAHGGANGTGSVFAITASGKIDVLYSFKSFCEGDGDAPSGALVNLNGVLYGTTGGGGSTCNQSESFGGCGAVFSLTPSGQESVLYSFKCYPDAAHPGGGPGPGLVNVNGVLYGTAPYGGSERHGPYCKRGDGDVGCGAIFAITTSGSEKVVYSFGGRHDGGHDGAHPTAGLVDVKGTLYGVTPQGGAVCNDPGCGTVFSVTTSGKEKILHSFGMRRDGNGPVAGLVNVNGTLYGVTRYGGERGGQGTVFSITTPGTEAVLHRFDQRGARNPYATPISVNGTLYGTAQGGADTDGAVFSLRP